MDKKEILHYRDIFVEEGKRLGSIEERQKILLMKPLILILYLKYR